MERHSYACQTCLESLALCPAAVSVWHLMLLWREAKAKLQSPSATREHLTVALVVPVALLELSD